VWNIDNGEILVTTINPYTVVLLGQIEDTEISYPNNEALEIMSYQAAIDFKRKQGDADVTLLQMRLSEIWERFEDVITRDEYRVEKVQNVYPSRSY
jgi:hypothetical protein